MRRRYSKQKPRPSNRDEIPRVGIGRVGAPLLPADHGEIGQLFFEWVMASIASSKLFAVFRRWVMMLRRRPLQ